MATKAGHLPTPTSEKSEPFDGIELPDTYRTRKKHWLMSSRKIQACFDVLLFIVVAGILLIIMMHGKSREIGFFCNDVTLMYPYKGESIPRGIIYLSIGGAILITILAVEYITQVLHSRRPHGRCVQYLLSVLKLLMLFIYGNIVTMVITQSLRLIGGHLRPHFLATCMPNVNLTNCENRYISDYNCTNTDEEAVLDARQSFPSLEGAFSVYNTVVILIYLEEKRVLRFSVFLKSIVQWSLVLYCTGINMLQFSDHRHHWYDIIASVLIGTVTGIWSVFCLTNHVRKQSVIKRSNGFGDVNPDDMFLQINYNKPIKNNAGRKTVVSYIQK